MIVLAIETSCDDTSVAVLKGHKVLSNTTYSQAIHQEFGGVVPELASRAHDQKMSLCVKSALKEAGFINEQEGMKSVDLIAVTQGPGLLGSLLVGLTYAKALALSWKKPLIGINHMDAHIYANFIDHKPQFPFLALVVSGGHTQLVKVSSYFEHEILGQTRDDAAGEAFDKSGKLLGLNYPAGPEIDRRAKEGNRTFLKLPIALKNEGLDFSFSGLKTAVLYAVQDLKAQVGEEKVQNEYLNDICASISDAITSALVLKTKRALKQHPEINDVVLAGGVSANSMLREKMNELAHNLHLNLAYPAMQYCTDNGAMIGITAALKWDQMNEKLTFDPTMLEMKAYAR